MISINGLTKTYGDKVIFSSLTFSIEENVCTAFTGASGIGKTTLLRCISGLEKYDSGSIAGISDKKLSFVFQENRLSEQISVLDNILCVAPDRKKAENLLEYAGLKHDMNSKTGKLSGGMKRRLAIVRALCYGGDIFFLDEPLRELDEDNAENMQNLIKKETAGKTVLLITHDISQAQYLSQKQLHFEGTPMKLSMQ